MAQIDTLLTNDHRCERVAIVGLGGVGKTQIALQFAHRWREKHPDCAVFWIPVTGIGSMLAAYLEIGQQLQIPNVEQNKSEVPKLVQRELSQEAAGRWLLVFDNADDIDLWTEETSSVTGSSRHIDLLPKSKHGSILFTTRSGKAAVKLAGKNRVFVSEMDDVMARDLLQKSLVNEDLLEDEQAAAGLLLKLTHLPLAIVQAAAYINENDIDLSEYAKLLDDTEQNVIDVLSEEFEDEGRYANIKNPIATTWLISFEQIQKSDPLAAEYLSFMSCIAAKDIPLSLLPPAVSAKKTVDAIGTLTAYSFVTKHKTGQFLDLHRLVHLAIRNWLRSMEILGQWAVKALQRLVQVFPNGDPENRSVWRMYLPHARSVLESDFEEDVEEQEMELLGKFGGCMYSDGSYEDAELAHTRATEIAKRTLGEEHEYTLSSLDNLAMTYRARGRWKEAEELHVQVLETSKRVLGDEHPDTLRNMNDLAMTYCDQERWKEAEELHVQVLETSKRVLGDEHPDTLRNMSSLASTYCDQGRWKEAEELHVQVLETSKRVLGDEHLDTLRDMNNLTMTYWDQERWKEAEELHVQVLETMKRVLGDEHPDTLISMSNLASTYGDQEQWKEAKELEVQVLEKSKRVLGDEHPHTLLRMYNLAGTLHDLSQNDEAISLMEQCFQLRLRILGPHHQYTEASLEFLNRWRREKVESEM
jgi:tetratricopeptide (TPR) repeat protein